MRQLLRCVMLGAAVWGLAGAASRAALLEDGGRALEASPDATVITADKLTFDYLKQFAKFDGNVLVNDPRMQLSAEQLTVIFSREGGAQTIKAEGKVLMSQEDKKARADVATYDVKSGRIVLTGAPDRPPQVLQGRNILEGEVITFWRDEQRVECQPRARLIVYSEDFGKDPDSFLRKGEAD
ncbi:MAG: hypothetical protein GX803_06205 [Lentisphaerae bacterium]|nr:hypothetical protein [Lentisphaerota bacterium]